MQAGPPRLVSAAQLAKIKALVERRGCEDELDRLLGGRPVADLTAIEASRLIEHLIKLESSRRAG